MMNENVKSLIQRFLKPPQGNSPQDVRAKLLHWRRVIRNPELISKDTHPEALKAAQRNARQNVRRLIQRHPVLCQQIIQELEQVQEQEQEVAA